jgi:hypothetical protein
VLALFVSVPLVAQNAIYVFPPTPRTPVGGVQSVTAVVTGNANKTVNWSSTCGTLVGSGNTIGVTTSGTGTCTITATMAADGVTAASSVVTFEPVRTDLQAAGIHPRLGLTAADVTDMQTKIANAGNVAYTHGLAPYFSYVQSVYNAGFCWTGGGCGAVGPIGTIDPSTGWVDGLAPTDEAFTYCCGGYLEPHTALYALMALIDPVIGNRATWAAHAHDMSMWEMNEICYGAYSGTGPCVARSGDSSVPFISTAFYGNNRSQQAVPLQLQAIDWNYSSFSSADKAIIAQVGHIWGQEATYGDSVAATDEYVTPTGAYNTSAIISDNVEQGEWAANNFGLSHFQLLANFGLLLDPADDPSISSCASSTTTICSTDGTAKTVGAYGVSAVKGWLYRINSLFEDQHIVDSEYGLSDPFLCPDVQIGTTACTGRMSGGQSSEGTGYTQISMNEMFNGVYALYTAGKLNPSTDPQASFISSSWWDKMVLSLVAQLYLVKLTSDSAGGYYIPFGDDSQSNGNMAQMPLFNIMEVYDAKYGSTWRKNIEKWYTYNALAGSYSRYGYVFIAGRLGGDFWAPNVIQATSGTNDGDLDGSGNPSSDAYDPRSATLLPLDFENLSSNGGFYRYYGRGSWALYPTEFQFGCSTSTINHASTACGRIDYVRNGEALAIGMNGTGNNNLWADSPDHQNTPGYQWNPSFDCTIYNNLIFGVCSAGGQMGWSWEPSSNYVLATSSNSIYYYGAVDSSLSNAFYDNGSDYAASKNTTLAQREVLWLKPDQTWVYDRTAQAIPTGFQHWYLDLETEPTISGNLATTTSTYGGQKLYVTSLLPGISALTTYELSKPDEQTANSPMNYALQDVATPAATNRMLHTLEGKDSGAASATALVQSSAGQGFDGSTIGTTLAMFAQTRGSFTGTTYPASGATTQYVTGLSPNTSYAIAGAGAPASGTTDTAGVLTFAAAGTGNITVGTSNAPSLQSIAVTPSTVVLQALGNQQYTAACTYSDGSTANCTSSATWASSSMGVITVNNAGMATGVAQGNASIIATSGSIQGQAAVTVPAATLQKVTVTPGSLTVPVGSAQQFKATGTYSDSSTTDVTSQVTWSSSNPAVVASNSAGLASTMSQGNASIIAASGKVQGQAAVIVSAAVAAPNFSPTAGTYTSAQTVTISTTTPSATIYYTTNGATPTASSPVYSGPITVSASETLEAIAVASGGSASSASSAAYTITPPTATPAFSPAGGTYSSAQTVSISTTTPSAKIYYTTNGATPTASSPVYSGPITVSASETLEAIAVATGDSASSASSAAYTITPPTATPAFSPAGGTYTSAQTVSISTTTPSATIYYTTNGATPTTSSPVYSGPITVSASETLEAIAVASLGSASSAGSAAYTITPPTGTPAFSPAGGTYSSAQTVSISTTTPSATIYYTTNGATPTTSSPVYSGPITVSASETVEAIAVASGGSASSASSAAYTITPPTATPAFSPAGGTYSSAQTVSISTTTPSATIYYTTNGATPTTSSPVYSGPITVTANETINTIAVAAGYKTSAMGSASYTVNLPQAATPALSPATGTYSSAQTVTISTTTPSATIYYTTNGSTPTTSSAVYSGPITVSASETVEAIAVAAGDSTSVVGSADYTINPVPGAPTFSPAGGTYVSAQTVTIQTTLASATIYYTTNGSTPTTSSPIYSGSITVAASETIHAIAVAVDNANGFDKARGRKTATATYLASTAGSATYTIDLAAPTFAVTILPAALTVTAKQSGTVTVLVAPQNGFASSVSFSCSGLPAGTSCSFAPATVTPSGAVASTTLTIAVSTATAALSRNSSPFFPSSALAVILCCFGWKKRRGLNLLSLAIAAGLGLGLCTGCGVEPIFPLPTTSTVSVIAASGSVQPAAFLTLTVQ